MPAKSIKEAKEMTTREFLQGMLGGAFTKADIVNLKNLPAISKYLIRAAEVFLYSAEQTLNKQGRINTGEIISELGVSEVSEFGGTYSISIGYDKGSKAEKYYNYVNKGVTGFESNQPKSPYQFRSPWASKKMATAILKWIRTSSKLSLNEQTTQPKAYSKLQKKRQGVKKMASASANKKSLAYAISISIKRKGLKKSGFFDKATEVAFGKEFIKGLADIAAGSTVILIKSAVAE